MKTNKTVTKVEKSKNFNSQQVETQEQLPISSILKEFELIELEERFEMVQAAAADVVRCNNGSCGNGNEIG